MYTTLIVRLSERYLHIFFMEQMYTTLRSCFKGVFLFCVPCFFVWCVLFVVFLCVAFILCPVFVLCLFWVPCSLCCAYFESHVLCVVLILSPMFFVLCLFWVPCSLCCAYFESHVLCVVLILCLVYLCSLCLHPCRSSLAGRDERMAQHSRKPTSSDRPTSSNLQTCSHRYLDAT
jgi:hypothetical protein